MTGIAPRKLAAVLVALMLSATLALPAFADTQRGMGPWHGKGLERMAEALELSDGQREQIASTVENYRPQIRDQYGEVREHRQALHAATEDGFDEASAREHADALGEAIAEASFLMAQARADINETLTEEQREELAALHERMKERMRGRMQQRRG